MDARWLELLFQKFKCDWILRAWLDTRVLPAFAERVLPIDTTIARRCARLHVPDRCAERDALIAATALVHGMTVATRNIAAFAPSGVSLVHPWAATIPEP